MGFLAGYSDLYRGENLWNTLFTYGLMAFFLLVNRIDTWLLISIAINYVAVYQIIQSTRIERKRKRHDGERYLDTFTIREREHTEDIIFPIKGDIEPLELWTDSTKNIEKTQEYEEAEVLVLRMKKPGKRWVDEEKTDTGVMNSATVTKTKPSTLEELDKRARARAEADAKKWETQSASLPISAPSPPKPAPTTSEAPTLPPLLGGKPKDEQKNA